MRLSKVKSPSEHCSLDFLKGLQDTNYISETGIEYCAEEVDYLISLKQNRNEKKLETEFKKYMKYGGNND